MPYGFDAIAEAREIDETEDAQVTPAEPDDYDFDFDEFDCLEDALDALLEMGDE